MTVYSTDFAGQTIGANPTNFTNRYDAETSVSIENPAVGEQADRVLQFGTGDTGDVFQSFNDVDGDGTRDNVEILARYRITSDADRHAIFRVRASGTSGTDKTSYDAYVNGDTFAITRWNAGTGSVLITTPTESYPSEFIRPFDNFAQERANEWHWIRFRVNGTGATVTLQAKWWIDGFDEPNQWILEFADTNASRITAAGWVGIAKRTFTGNSYLDQFSAGTNGDTAVQVTDTTEVYRVTSSIAQTLISPNEPARVTSSIAQVLVTPDAPARVTSSIAQVLYTPAPVVSTGQSISVIIAT